MACVAPDKPIADVVVTDHAIKRYWERVPTSNDLDGPAVEQLIRDRLAQATFLYDGCLPVSAERRLFYIHDYLVLIVAPENWAVVTLYPADYGFGDAIDATIRKQLLKEVVALQHSQVRAEETARKTQSAVDGELDTMAQREQTLRAELALLEQSKAALVAKRSEACAAVSLIGAKLQEAAGKLVLSKRYNAETLATITTVANSNAARKK